MSLPYFSPINVVPTTILGLVQGVVRSENRTGSIRLIPGFLHLFIMEKPQDGFAITHLQKYSRFGFLLNWPFCFHIYFQFRKQQGNDERGWVPGSEITFYTRTPGYRQDTDAGVKWTWGYIGLHWD